MNGFLLELPGCENDVNFNNQGTVNVWKLKGTSNSLE